MTTSITEGKNPANEYIPFHNFDKDTWILIAILICIIVILLTALFIMWCVKQSKINKLQEQFKKEITDEETNLLLKYRNLNSRDKTIVQDTLKTLTENKEQQKE